jgi:hypothetical protein
MYVTVLWHQGVHSNGFWHTWNSPLSAGILALRPREIRVGFAIFDNIVTGRTIDKVVYPHLRFWKHVPR